MSNAFNADESILIGVRPMCNVDENDDGFDKQLIPLINAFMMIAHHDLGVGINGFNITGIEQTWSEWLGSAESKLSAAKTWLGYKTFLAFDPPENGSVMQAYEKMMNANCPKPHSRHCVLRREVGPIADINPQYIFGNDQMQVYVDAMTGEVRTNNPVFPEDFKPELGAWINKK